MFLPAYVNEQLSESGNKDSSIETINANIKHVFDQVFNIKEFDGNVLHNEYEKIVSWFPSKGTQAKACSYNLLNVYCCMWIGRSTDPTCVGVQLTANYHGHVVSVVKTWRA